MSRGHEIAVCIKITGSTIDRGIGKSARKAVLVFQFSSLAKCEAGVRKCLKDSNCCTLFMVQRAGVVVNKPGKESQQSFKISNRRGGGGGGGAGFIE
jgi:hypothetical protein